MARGGKKSRTLELEKCQGLNYIIPVMGPTGVGKSSFINQLLGEEVVEVGHSLTSRTIELQPVEIPADVIQQHLPLWNPVSSKPAKLIIVDTPGFDDTSADDSEILKCVAEWLAASYGVGAKLAGVIYLQEITLARVTGTTRKNIEVFEKLCGANACKSIVLGTTKWGDVPPEKRKIAEGREKDLQEKFWRDMIGKGSKMQRVDDEHTKSSPWDLVKSIFLKGGYSTLMIQRELMDMEKTLSQTEAAAVLRGMIEEHIKSLKNMGASEEQIRAFVLDVDALKGKSTLARFFGRVFG